MEGKNLLYVGETSDIFRRGNDHINGLSRRSNKSVLWDHSTRHHPFQPLGREDIDIQVTSKHKFPLSRQAEEGARILLHLSDIKDGPEDDAISLRDGSRRELRETILMNSRGEFHQPLGAIRTATTYM